VRGVNLAKGPGSVLQAVGGWSQVVLVAARSVVNKFSRRENMYLQHAGLVSLSVDVLPPKHRLPHGCPRSFQRKALPMLHPKQQHPPKAKIRLA
jgi:hypothetical protein